MTVGYVQVAADGSGKKIRNVVINETQPVDANGAAQADLVSYTQMIAVMDQTGNQAEDLAPILKEILGRLETQNELLEAILGQL